MPFVLDCVPCQWSSQGMISGYLIPELTFPMNHLQKWAERGKWQNGEEEQSSFSNKVHAWETLWRKQGWEEYEWNMQLKLLGVPNLLIHWIPNIFKTQWQLLGRIWENNLFDFIFFHGILWWFPDVSGEKKKKNWVLGLTSRFLPSSLIYCQCSCSLFSSLSEMAICHLSCLGEFP